MQNNLDIEQEIRVIASLQRDLNLVTAALLLTGQITIIGVFLTTAEFSLSLSGPLFGRARSQGKDKLSTALVDVIDVIIATLLIIDQIRVVSSVVGPNRFSINVSGPIFGYPLYEPTLPFLKKYYRLFQKIVSNNFDIEPFVFKKI